MPRSTALMRFLGVALLAVLSAWSSRSLGAGAVLVPSTQPAMQDRVYDIADLLVTPGPEVPREDLNPRPDSPAPATRPSPPDRAQVINDLLTWVRSLGDVTEIARVSESKGTMVVVATDAAHARLSRLLDEVRRQRSILITVETRQIRAPAEVLGTFPAALREKLDTARFPGSAASGIPLDNDEVNAMIRATQASKQATLVTAPRLTLYKGGTGEVGVATVRYYASRFERTIENQKPRFAPITTAASDGIKVRVRASATPGANAIALDMDYQAAQLLGFKTTKWPGSPPDTALAIQVPRLDEQHLSQTMSLNSGGTLLFFMPNQGEGGHGESWLLVNATIVYPAPSAPEHR